MQLVPLRRGVAGQSGRCGVLYGGDRTRGVSTRGDSRRGVRIQRAEGEVAGHGGAAQVECSCKLNAVDPALESAWFQQPLSL
jgi:hypothetical protein